MMTIQPCTLSGSLTVMSSKSVLHRLMICAAMAEGTSTITNFAVSDDVERTLHALRDMGFCEFELRGDVCTIHGGRHGDSKPVIHCGESGSTLRLLLPLAFDGQKRTFTGEGRLMERPMQPYDDLLGKYGYTRRVDSIEVRGELAAGEYALPGNVSSQFVSGLLFKLPLLGGNSSIVLTSELESRPYVELTMQALSTFSVHVTLEDIPGSQQYHSADIAAEGDHSYAAFFIAAAAMHGSITLRGLKRDSLQGDRRMLDFVKLMGADVHWDGDAVTVTHNNLRPLELDVSQTPDLVPALCVLACGVSGSTKITNAARLRFKESDRLHAMVTELEKLGADVVEYEDSITIHGTGHLNGGQVNTHNDHRIAMALSIAATIARAPITLDEPYVVNKSAPRFYQEFAQLGGVVE